MYLGWRGSLRAIGRRASSAGAPQSRCRPWCARRQASQSEEQNRVEQGTMVSLYTISSLPIYYGVWQIKGGSGGRSYIAQKSQ